MTTYNILKKYKQDIEKNKHNYVDVSDIFKAVECKCKESKCDNIVFDYTIDSKKSDIFVDVFNKSYDTNYNHSLIIGSIKHLLLYELCNIKRIYVQNIIANCNQQIHDVLSEQFM